MVDALDRVDIETVEFLGHQMSGSGGAYGFQGITDISAALEQADRERRRRCIAHVVGELSRCLDRVETISD